MEQLFYFLSYLFVSNENIKLLYELYFLLLFRIDCGLKIGGGADSETETENLRVDSEPFFPLKVLHEERRKTPASFLVEEVGGVLKLRKKFLHSRKLV